MNLADSCMDWQSIHCDTNFILYVYTCNATNYNKLYRLTVTIHKLTLQKLQNDRNIVIHITKLNIDLNFFMQK